MATANPGDQDSRTTASPRVVVLTREPGESYGFVVKMMGTHSGHAIKDIKKGGIAEKSGLKDGDRILEVNACFVVNKSCEEVAFRMNLSGTKVSLLVLSEKEYERHQSNLKSLINRSENIKRPRLCLITKDPVSGVGISFAPVKGQQGHFNVNVKAGGAAERAGVRKGDRLVWMNGVSAEDLNQTVINWMLRKYSSQITVLVIDAESEEYYNSQGIPILPAMATKHNIPFKSRRHRLVPGDDGYGFILRSTSFEPERKNFHTLRQIDPNSPAERAGIQSFDRLVEVNGESVEFVSHYCLVAIIRTSDELSLAMISEAGFNFYTMLGLSPLLFCEDDRVEDEDKNVLIEEEGGLPIILVHEEKKSSIRARVCNIQRVSLEYGFNLTASADNSGSGIIISQVTDGGPGQEAGLQEGDEVLEINGLNVEGKTLVEVQKLLEEGGATVSVQVIQKLDQDRPNPEAEVEEEITRL